MSSLLNPPERFDVRRAEGVPVACGRARVTDWVNPRGKRTAVVSAERPPGAVAKVGGDGLGAAVLAELKRDGLEDAGARICFCFVSLLFVRECCSFSHSSAFTKLLNRKSGKPVGVQFSARPKTGI